MRVNQYLRKLGITSRSKPFDVYYELAKELSYADAMIIQQCAVSRGESNTNNKNNVYEFVHEKYNRSIKVSSLWDGDIIEKFLNHIYDNRDKFGDSILDLGCGNGIITCYLALLFPNSKVVGIDHMSEAIEIAKQIADKLRISNVEFIACDTKDYNNDEKFDNVITCRILAENLAMKVMPSPLDSLKAGVRIIAEGMKKHHEKVVSYLKPNGYLMQYEHTSLDMGLVPWQYSLSNFGLQSLETANETVIVGGAVQDITFMLSKNIGSEAQCDVDSCLKEAYDALSLKDEFVEWQDFPAKYSFEYGEYTNEKSYAIYEYENILAFMAIGKMNYPDKGLKVAHFRDHVADGTSLMWDDIEKYDDYLNQFDNVIDELRQKPGIKVEPYELIK